MPTPMRTLKLVNKIKKSGVVKQGSMKKENKYLKMLGTKATVMHPTTKVAKKVDKADVRKYVQKGWIHMTTKKNQLRKEDASNRSADKKPEKYIGPDGKTKIRMVPVDKEIQKDEGYVSHAQRKAVWANKADGGKGHPDNKRKSKKESQNAALMKKLAKSAQSSEKGKKAVTLKPAPFKIPAKEATIPQGQTAMTKRPEPTDKDKRTISKIQDLMKRANEQKVDEIARSMTPMRDRFGKSKAEKGIDALKKAGNAKADAEAGERRKDNAMNRFKAAKDDARNKMKTAKNSADMVKQMNRAQSASKAVKRISRLRDWMEK